jgi:hypothetical protein
MMPRRRKIRIIAAIASVTFASLVQFLMLQSTSGFKDWWDWWLILNIVPFLFAFAANFIVRLPGDPAFYAAIVVQWGLLGVLFGDLYIKYVRPQVS